MTLAEDVFTLIHAKAHIIINKRVDRLFCLGSANFFLGVAYLCHNILFRWAAFLTAVVWLICYFLYGRNT